jgi:pyridoxamine 5'-phosphate oxidase
MPPLRREDLDPDPVAQFGRWWERALKEVPVAEAMALATVDPEGAPDARMVLLKGFDERGFRFHTNYESAKGVQLGAVDRAALVIYWRELDRQVRVRGEVERLSAAESDEYWLTRPRESQLGALASPQSEVLASRDALDEQQRAVKEGFEGEAAIPRPEHWGGYLLRPQVVEFWQGQVARLHDRFRYSRADAGWRIDRLAP